ncbi:GntR family transcriptional regulator [Jeotgalibacillus proteolyticus]|uniref:Phosphonate metabolism transcriptional regulator PhnF n=1 Tax=Jeotgalibacillus proteolyticus TaxID=2082395 RepID=A0A2S5G8E6_9BACL|nr:GntR family transcriptional regulator [Jeotgalibacillus proteolyticus]PPA69277.1 phosphonate metabolism transcriptional regulator PhnF [Jeotgalibacillus proteolyticus]
MLNKKSPLPLYAQIEENIKGQIQEGAFKPGDPIPSERELTSTYQVSRMTVRQAVLNLVKNGLLYREKGKGTFVSEEKIEQPLQGLTSFTEDMRSRGMEPGNELISFERVIPSFDIADKLGLEIQEEVFFVKRIRYADHKPMAIESTYLPSKLFPALTEQVVQGSLYDYIASQMLIIGQASQSIEAGLASTDEAELLQIEEPSAVLKIERLSYLTTGTPFEVVHSTYRADRYKFRSEIKR